MLVEVSNGELLDKFSILQIKLRKIVDSVKLSNIKKESSILEPLCNTLFEVSTVYTEYQILLQINETLWDIEDAIREKERRQEFDSEFVSLARNVYFTNDRRSEIKKKINLLTNSLLMEEKSYESY